MAATLTAYNDALKRVYTQDRLESQLYQENPFLDKLGKSSRVSIGEVARVPLHVSRNGGFTVLPGAGGNLNAAGEQGISKAEYSYTHQHQQIQIQGSVLDQASGNANTVADVLETEVSGALDDLRKQITRQLFQDGSAKIVACGTTSSSTTVTLNATEGVEVLERGWLFPGQLVDIGTAASEASVADGVTITAVSESGPSITVSGSAISTSSSNFVSIKNARAGATSYEANGLRNLVSTSASFGGVDPATYAWWKAANVDTSTTTLSLEAMLTQEQKINQRGAKADFVLTGLKQSRKFYALLQNQVRFAGDNGLSAGAQDAPKWNGLEVHRHPDCYDEDMYFGAFKHLFIVATAKPSWQSDVTGGEILSWIQGTDSYGAKLSYRFNLGSNRRNAFARLGALA
jgi:hypothetical protein